MELKAIKKLRQYSGSNVTPSDNTPLLITGVLNDPSHETDALQKMIFAPDPNTGIPQSDIALMYSNDRDPQISQYIQDRFMRPHPMDSSSPDADAALEMLKGRNESLVDYASRLREIANPPADENT